MSVKSFYEQLDEQGQEFVKQLINDWTSECCEEKLDRMDHLLRELRQEIDRVNRKREYLSGQLRNVQAVKQRLAVFCDSKGGDLQLGLFLNVLMQREQALKHEINVLKPDLRLKKKYEIGIAREKLLGRREIAQGLFNALFAEDKIEDEQGS